MAGNNTFNGPDSGPAPPFMQYAGAAPPWNGWGNPNPWTPFPAPIFPASPYPMPGTFPSNAPVTDGGIPGSNLRNQYGGVGLPPGYNYLFPASHCMIHVFQTGSTAPWQALTPLWNHDSANHKKFFVPANMTVLELMKALGANNEDKDKNVMTEVQEGGNGKWLKGMVFKGGDKDRMKMRLGELGWELGRRSGLPGKGPVVWVYVTND